MFSSDNIQKFLASMRQLFKLPTARRMQSNLKSKDGKYDLSEASGKTSSPIQDEIAQCQSKAESQHVSSKHNDQKTNPDFIQIEDEFIIRTLWEVKAEKYGLHGLFLNTYQALEEMLPNVDKSTPIFIDIQLPNSTKDGFEIASALHCQGYTALYLSTGSLASEIQETPWIKETVGKDFPTHILVKNTKPTT
ncbi:hypothetical protein [Zooshikella ganghwensis]|nr:hypothetical protein [Zooshikella ganghwensis]